MLSFPGTSNTELQDNDKDPLEYFLNDKIQELLIALTGKFYLSVGLKQGAFREGQILRQCQDFREKFGSKFWISLYILYIFTSPSVQDREKTASLGRLFLSNRPLKKPTDLDLHYLSFSMWIYINNVDYVILLADN